MIENLDESNTLSDNMENCEESEQNNDSYENDLKCQEI